MGGWVAQPANGGKQDKALRRLSAPAPFHSSFSLHETTILFLLLPRSGCVTRCVSVCVTPRRVDHRWRARCCCCCCCCYRRPACDVIFIGCPPSGCVGGMWVVSCQLGALRCVRCNQDDISSSRNRLEASSTLAFQEFGSTRMSISPITCKPPRTRHHK